MGAGREGTRRRKIPSCGLISGFRAAFLPQPMNRLSPLFAVFVMSVPVLKGGEIPVETQPFTIEKAATAVVLPVDEVMLLQLDPKAWTEFKITELAEHGGKVAKGDPLVRFDADPIDRRLVDFRRSIATGTLNLAQAELDLKNLVETAPHRLAAERRAAEVAREENTYFVKTRRKAQEEESQQSLERRKQTLENQQEELKQLSQMYAADEVTEETEEIILTRQKNSVIAAEFSLRMGELEHQRTLEVILPREAEKLANAERDTAISLLKAEQDIPRGIELKKLEIESLKTGLERDKQVLAELEADRLMFEFKAPGDGWFYHGAIEDGRWVTGDLVKAVVPHGKPAVNRAFATFVPATSGLGLTAFLDEAAARSIPAEVAGTASFTGREDIEVPVKLTRLAKAPGADGLYRADFSATWNEEAAPVIGSTAQIRMIAYHQPQAIAIPSKALGYGVDGWTAEVKLADGKSERRPVRRGRVSADLTEILSGLEVGQVVIDPSASGK